MTLMNNRHPILRRVSALAACLALSSAVVACGSDGNGTTTEGSGSYPVTVSTSSGNTVVQSEPKRIVTLQNIALENVVALDKTPTTSAVTKSFKDYTYYSTWKDADYIRTDIRLTGDIDIEAIANEKPDLIIAPSWPAFTEATMKEKLQSIATTLIFDTQNNGSSWQTGLSQVAQALNATDKADSVITEYGKKTSSAREQHPELKDRTYDFGMVFEGDISLSSAAEETFADMNLKPSRSQSSITKGGGGIGGLKVPRESFGTIAGDIVYLTASGKDVDAQDREEFNQIKGKIVWDDGQIGNAVNNSGPVGHLWLPTALANALSAG